MPERLRSCARHALAALLLAAASLPAAAQQARPMAADPKLEQQVLEIATELRCLVCQNETIAASHADLAVDLRGQIREQLKAGRSEREILDYMVQRYGDFVLYTPPVKPTTWLLWAGPFVLLVAMAALMSLTVRRRRAALAAQERPLSEAESARARALLDKDPA
jgi:cytochrome c-type biogenesis protein CcmH